MPAQARRHTKLLGATALATPALVAIAIGALSSAAPATGANLNQLQSELGANNVKAGSLSSGISTLTGQISSLSSQISLVQTRAAAVHDALAKDQAAIARDRIAIRHERKVTARVKARLKLAQRALSAELVDRYEQPQQTLVSLVIDSSGFQQMLDRLQFMKRANDAEQRLIRITQRAKAEAQAATARLTGLERSDQQAAARRLTQARALTGMQALLNSRRASLAHIQAARTAALQAVRAQGAQLQSAITTATQQLAAAQRAQQLSGSSPGTGSAPSDPGAYDGWAIPYAIVLCESGGQNLPPNSAGASGYYQIIPGTWKEYGGSTAQAYQASKSEQGAVAARIWDGGGGASNWTCAAIVGVS